MSEPALPTTENVSICGFENVEGAPQHATLKYSLLGPSLLKAGQESVDQEKVSDIIYNASKGSKYFAREKEKDNVLSLKIEHLLAKKAQLEGLELCREQRTVDFLISQLDAKRDLSQYIVHVDCDAFYAAVELLDRPELENSPFAVGRGVLTTCNYAARKFGCRSGMAAFVAKKLCPQLTLLKPNFTKYNEKAREIRGILKQYDPSFESASVDEAYLNLTEFCTSNGLDPGDAVEQLRREIFEKAKITVSAGISANARLAKICSDINKPNGQFILPNDRKIILDFMKDLPCRKVNGIGRVFERELSSIGIDVCGDIYPQRQLLTQLFGEKACRFLIHCYLGLGRTRLQSAGSYERKSVGTESTFETISGSEKLRQKLQSTAEELEKDLRSTECKGRTLVLKVKLHTFEVHTRQIVMSRGVDSADEIYKHAIVMLGKLEQDIPGMKVRLMGLRCTRLSYKKKLGAFSYTGSNTTIKQSADDMPCGLAEPQQICNEAFSLGSRADAIEQSDALLEDAGFQETNSYPRKQISFSFQPQQRESPFSPSFDLQHEKEAIGRLNQGPDKLTGQDEQEDDLWQCPVCFRLQPIDEKQFNDHMDACLSRRTILEALRETQKSASQTSISGREKKTARAGKDKRRRNTAQTGDFRQKKLCFGEV